MGQGRLSRIVGMVMVASLAIAGLLGAQDHFAKHGRYNLVDLGTFGGANSNFQGAGAVVVNVKGAATGSAETPVVDPILGPLFHAFRWENGVLTDLGTLPEGALSVGQAINSRGVIAGASTTGVMDPVFGPEFVATAWKKNGEIVDLGTLGGEFSITNAINDRGQVVGGATNTIPDPDNFGFAVTDLPTPTQWHAALWQNGTIQDLGTLGNGTVSFANFVNRRGQVIGISTTDTTPTVYGIPTLHPFFWEDGRGLADVGTLGGVYSTASGLNSRGQVVGFSTLAGDLGGGHAFLWAHGAMRDLGFLGGDYSFSEANAINDSGEIAGHSFTADQTVRGFRWKRGVMSDLGSVPGYDCSNTGSINAGGQIAGWAYHCDDPNAPNHAVLWDKKGPGIDLNTFVPPGSDLELIEAEFISDRGEIAGLAFLPNGDAHAFLLIPEEHDDLDAPDDATSTSQIEVAPATESATSVTHTALPPERLMELRARFANRHHGFRLKLPKRQTEESTIDPRRSCSLLRLGFVASSFCPLAGS